MRVALVEEGSTLMHLAETPIQISVPALVKALEQLPPAALDELMAHARLLQQQHKQEQSLLAIIQRRLPVGQDVRLHELSVKLENETISDSERAELLYLADQAEALDSERAQALLTLAQQRGISVRQLLQDLHLNSRYG